MGKFVSIKICILGAVFLLTGCASVTLPKYVSDNHPYKQTFYATFDETLEAVNTVLADSDWQVIEQVDPTLYERNKEAVADGLRQQTLIFTDVRSPLFDLGTKHSRVNAYLRSVGKNETEVELRYVTMTKIPFKKFYGYKKDKTVNAMLEKLSNLLGS